jgi:hypothetical protein
MCLYVASWCFSDLFDFFTPFYELPEANFWQCANKIVVGGGSPGKPVALYALHGQSSMLILPFKVF